jgi:hypothetical protein
VTADPYTNQDDENGSYGYIRVVEGSATLMQAGSGDRVPAEINQPLMVGDRIQVADGAKVEIILADRNMVRLDGGSELLLEHLAASPDANDRATVLRLLEGDVQLVVSTDSLGDELPRLDTPNATVYPQDFGNYRIAADQGGWSEVTVRRGKAQVVTDDGSENVLAGEQAVIEDGIDVRDATGYDGLERWAQRLDQDYQSDELSSVDPDLRYSAAPLNRYGSWVTVEGASYWRPRVGSDWRPYTDGRWVYTPSGMTWVSAEPWGWVPSHYGSWDYITGYGWLWQPGYVYAPAWVYWYWGPSYTGWCPMGYYTRYYASAGFSGFHAGIYGYAGGDWGLFSRWTFVPSSYWRGYRDGYRNGVRDAHWHEHWDVRRYAVPIDEFRRNGRTLERGVITTDTRPLRPDTWSDSRRAIEVLRNHPSGRRNGQGGQGGDLPDVSSFVARKPQLPPNVAQVVKGGQDDINRYVGTPLRPNTLGRGDRGGRGVRGARVTPVPQGPAGADRSGTPGDNGRTPRVRPVPGPGEPAMPRPGRSERNGGVRVTPVPGDQGGAPRPDRGGRNGQWDRGTRVTPVDPPTANQPAPRNPREGRPAPGDQGGAPRPDRGDRGRQGARVTPVTPPSSEQPGARPDRSNRGDRGNQGDRGDQGNRGNRDRESPPRREPDRPAVRPVDPPPPSSYRSYDRGPSGGDRSGSGRPAYDRPAPPERSSRPAERYSPPPPPRQEARPAPAPERQAPPRAERAPERRAPEPQRPPEKPQQRRNRHGDDGN